MLFRSRELLVPVIKEGKRVYTSPSVMELRAICQKEQSTLWDESRRFSNPQKVYVDLSPKLFEVKRELIEEMSRKDLEFEEELFNKKINGAMYQRKRYIRPIFVEINQKSAEKNIVYRM